MLEGVDLINETLVGRGKCPATAYARNLTPFYMVPWDISFWLQVIVDNPMPIAADDAFGVAELQFNHGTVGYRVGYFKIMYLLDHNVRDMLVFDVIRSIALL